jgi:hypothetical protein
LRSKAKSPKGVGLSKICGGPPPVSRKEYLRQGMAKPCGGLCSESGHYLLADHIKTRIIKEVGVNMIANSTLLGGCPYLFSIYLCEREIEADKNNGNLILRNGN